MKTFTINQEILFLTNNRFSEKEFCENKDQDDNQKKPRKEQLMHACWNGLITELLPELQMYDQNKKLRIWEVMESKNFIGMHLGSLEPVDEFFSLNPYIFYDCLCVN